MQDSDLIFLKDCSNEQLKALVDILVFDKDGKKRHTESLSNSQAFVANYPGNIKALIPQIVDEIQRFGGNTIMNAVRGHGVPYREILEDVCNRLKVNYNKKLATDLLETELLKKVAVTVLEKMTDEDIKKFNENLDKTRFIDAVMHNNNGAIASIIAIVVAQISKQAAQKGCITLIRTSFSSKSGADGCSGGERNCCRIHISRCRITCLSCDGAVCDYRCFCKTTTSIK